MNTPIEKPDASTQEILEQLRLLNKQLGELTVAVTLGQVDQTNVIEFPWREHRIFMYVPWAQFDYIQRSIVLRRSFYELSLLNFVHQHVSVGEDAILDCGANIGNHAVYFGTTFPGATVHAFEALPNVFSILERNVELNPQANIIATNAVLGTGISMSKMTKFRAQNVGATAFTEEDNGENGYGPPTLALSSLDFGRVGLIKIDVEGMQLPLLRGAADLISEHKPYVWVEVNPADDDIRPTMSDLGYGEPLAVGKRNFLYRP